MLLCCPLAPTAVSPHYHNNDYFLSKVIQVIKKRKRERERGRDDAFLYYIAARS